MDADSVKALITAIRSRAVVISQKHPKWPTRPCSPGQRTTINIALGQIIGKNRDDRIRVLHAIFPEGIEKVEIDECGTKETRTTPLWSSSHLTFAQAWVLMELLYRLSGQDSFYVGRPLYQKAIDFFTEMVDWTKEAGTQAELWEATEAGV